MIVALRYVERNDGYWEVRTEESIERCTSLRQFPQQNEVVALATRALQVPGAWVHMAPGKEQAADA